MLPEERRVNERAMEDAIVALLAQRSIKEAGKSSGHRSQHAPTLAQCAGVPESTPGSGRLQPGDCPSAAGALPSGHRTAGAPHRPRTRPHHSRTGGRSDLQPRSESDRDRNIEPRVTELERAAELSINREDA
jgi:hypothetical protein